VRRILISLAILATLIALFYTEEDWRGKRAWENCKRELEANGAVLDWYKYIPPPVPDDQNFFKAPNMTEWFVGRHQSELNKRLASAHSDVTASVGPATNLIVTAKDAQGYLDWSDQFEPDFNSIHEALQRPYARIDGDYSEPYAMPIPNFLTMRVVAQMLSQRAHSDLLLNRPQAALQELTLMHDTCRLLEGAPTGKPMTIVAAMINVAVHGLYLNKIEEGCRLNAWQEPQLVELQRQLDQIHLPVLVVQGFATEPAATTHALETTPPSKMQEWFSMGGKTSRWQEMKWSLFPRGWIYQNMATDARLVLKQADGFDPANDVIQPDKFGDLTREMTTIARPYKILVSRALPNFTRAWQTTAHCQAMVNEAQIACALERYHLIHGEYPEMLDALVPQFIQKLPHDIIGGQPLHYQRTDNGKFLLYSIGWNETDDGGLASPMDQYGTIDYNRGDWVWKN